jgi:hypothetical protein
MAKGNDKNYISFWHWMLIILLTALPCVGLIVIIIGAFLGDNESRKNYCRALIAWFLVWALLFLLFWVLVMVVGFFPDIHQLVQDWLHRMKSR